MANERTFRDGNGIEWRVSCVAATTEVGPDAPSVWLSFESVWMERRLSPVPQNWQAATLQRLEQMCRIATPVQRDDTVASPTVMVSSESEPASLSAVDATDGGEQEPSLSSTSSNERVSRLVDVWPAREARITFRG
jgi:hypothetical protein